MFNWLRKLLPEVRRAGDIENPSIPIGDNRIWEILADGRSASGIRVNRETVYGMPPVWRGVNLISSRIADLPIQILKSTSQGKELDKSHPAYTLLSRKPNSETTIFDFTQTLMGHALLNGNGYSSILRNQLGEPIELFILNPEATWPFRENGLLRYKTTIGTEEIIINASDMIHLKGLSYDGMIGYSVIDILRDGFGVGMSAQRYGLKFFANDAGSKYVIELPHGLKDQEAIERFRLTWGSVHRGIDNSHRPALLENGAKVQAFSMDNEKSQFLQTREFELVNIANILGLPASYLGSAQNTSFGSLEAENKSLLNNSLAGWLAKFEQELSDKLLREDEKRNDTHIILFNRRELERSDSKTEIEVLSKEVDTGLRTLNEAREALGLPPLPQEEAGLPRMPSNLLLLGQEPEPVPEPEPVVELVEEEPEEVEEPQEDERLRALTRTTINRLATRVARHCKKAAKTPKTFIDFLDDELRQQNYQIFVDNIAPVFNGDSTAIANEYFVELHQRLLGLTGDTRAEDLADHIDSFVVSLEANTAENILRKYMP